MNDFSIHKKNTFCWLSWGVALSFFAFQFILRLLPGLIMTQVMDKFQIDSSHYGFLSSMYYFGYAGAQIPVALLLDRLGPRKVISTSALICGLGTFIFARTDQWTLALLGRFLIGAGSAAGFLGTAKVISQWFRHERYAKMIGITFTFGLIGAVYGGKPVASWIALEGWQTIFDWMTIISLSIGVVSALFLRDSGPFSTYQKPPQLADFKILMSNKKLIALACCNLLMVGPVEGFADVWGVSFLMKAYELQRLEAASLTSLIFVGMVFGGPLLAFFAEKWNAFFELMAFCGLLNAIIFTSLLCLTIYHSGLMYFYMILVGILSCYQVLVFAIGSNLTPKNLLSTTLALLNCMNMLGGSFFHSIIGLTLDVLGSEESYSIAKTYTSSHYSHYRVALAVIPLASFLGALGIWALAQQKSNKIPQEV